MTTVPTLTKQEKELFEPTAKILAANGVAQSLSFTSERKYLDGITSNSVPLFLELMSKRKDLPSAPYWIKISQIGKPIEDSAEKCFTSIQKILTSCFLPNKVQLIFLVHGKKGVYEMYLGLRSLDKENIDSTFVDSVNDFIKGIWPGIKSQRIKGDCIDSIEQDIINKYDCIDSLTGIPSMESQYKTFYPSTIDTLLAGMQKKDFTYMVIADPVKESDIDSILYKVRDFNGQAESLKSFNFSESTSDSISETLSESKSICDSTSESYTKKSKLGMVGAGIMLASYMFPPAGALTTALAIAAGANEIAGANLFAEFSPSYTRGKSHSETITNGKSETVGQTQGKSISSNIVNKQIEAVAEHLFYHSKRLETGKAIGCWSVGVYVMGENRHVLQGASMQLKSIVSGQESIFEPVRIHHIEDVINDSVPQTLGCMSAPIIKVKSMNGEYFDHPLGVHFNELKTLLTTKELSYFVNFPLKGVPGISVVDSSPEFSLNEQGLSDSEPTISIGKMLYGGSLTNMDYKIPIRQLSRHTLLSGINGTGKTNTVMSILNGIGELPFLVIEPAKTEYVDWAIKYNSIHKDNPIDIYIPGCKKYKGSYTPLPLHLNPFELVWLDSKQEPNVLSHIDRVKSTFAAAFPMYDILPVLMEDLIYTIYQNKSTDWLTKNPVFGETMPPTLNSMSVTVDKVISNRGYEDRVERNMKACLNTRIDSLKRGWKGEMLNVVNSTGWENLFGKPCVINLSFVGDDVDKSFLMALILQFLYEYRTAQAEVGLIDFNDNGCKHLTIIEEAHRVMSKCDNQELPQYKSAMMFSNMLSEIRAYGEGLMLVDQVPTRLIPDAIKNTNLKITHRLVAEDDCKAIGESMGLNEQQRKMIPKLLTGQCIVNSSLSTDTNWIKINKIK